MIVKSAESENAPLRLLSTVIGRTSLATKCFFKVSATVFEAAKDPFFKEVIISRLSRDTRVLSEVRNIHNKGITVGRSARGNWKIVKKKGAIL